jgi:hypothetical protein
MHELTSEPASASVLECESASAGQLDYTAIGALNPLRQRQESTRHCLTDNGPYQDKNSGSSPTVYHFLKGQVNVMEPAQPALAAAKG